jgi:hypothetical protein
MNKKKHKKHTPELATIKTTKRYPNIMDTETTTVIITQTHGQDKTIFIPHHHHTSTYVP